MSERNKKSFIRDGLYNIERTMQLDPAAHSKWEVFWLYPHIKAIGLHRIAHWFWVHNHTFIARCTTASRGPSCRLKRAESPKSS